MKRAVNDPAAVPAAVRRGSAGFSMIEILLAAMVLSIGFIMLLPAFVTGINESRLSIEASTVVQLGQNAEGFLHGSGNLPPPNLAFPYAFGGLDRYLDPYKDGTLVADGNIHAYQFGANGALIPNDATIRVLGAAATSKYYWSLLYRFPVRNTDGTYSKSVVECWIMVCKREEIGVDANNHPLHASDPVSVSGSGGVGSGGKNNPISGDSIFLQPNTGSVTDQGEILRISYNQGGQIVLLDTVRQAFSGVWVVPAKAGDLGNASNFNACMGVLHTYVGN